MHQHMDDADELALPIRPSRQILKIRWPEYEYFILSCIPLAVIVIPLQKYHIFLTSIRILQLCLGQTRVFG